MLQSLAIILVGTRFPENIGMVARAMANMGAEDLILVAPERWDRTKAESLATAQGVSILERVKVEPDLETALKSFAISFATTARTGGWRQTSLLPEAAAKGARNVCRQGARAAFVFGPEDRGLLNTEITLCTETVTIPTAPDHSSLNLAQAVLLLLYESMKADLILPFSPMGTKRWTKPLRQEGSRLATSEEEGLLFFALQDMLLQLGKLPKDNPDWFMQPIRRFVRKSRLRRHEFDMLMGVCRQVTHVMRKKR